MIRKVWLFLFPLLLALDVFSKMIALEAIPPFVLGEYPYGGIPLFSNLLGISFSLNTVVNTGAAWGVFQGHSALLFAFRLAVILGLTGYLLFSRAPSKWPLWLVAIGASGNAIDYALYGHVIDFFHFVFWGYSFPVFNLADSYITLGALGVLFFSPSAKQQTRAL